MFHHRLALHLKELRHSAFLSKWLSNGSDQLTCAEQRRRCPNLSNLPKCIKNWYNLDQSAQIEYIRDNVLTFFVTFSSISTQFYFLSNLSEIVLQLNTQGTQRYKPMNGNCKYLNRILFGIYLMVDLNSKSFLSSI